MTLTARKLDKIHETIIFRHWEQGGKGLGFLREGQQSDGSCDHPVISTGGTYQTTKPRGITQARNVGLIEFRWQKLEFKEAEVNEICRVS